MPTVRHRAVIKNQVVPVIMPHRVVRCLVFSVFSVLCRSIHLEGDEIGVQ